MPSSPRWSSDVLNPLIAATIGKPDFSGVVLNIGSGHIKIGNFLNAAVSFLIVATVVYFAIVLPLNHLQSRFKKPEPAAAPTTKPCPRMPERDSAGRPPLRSLRPAGCIRWLSRPSNLIVSPVRNRAWAPIELQSRVRVTHIERFRS